ncbi:MAG: AzlC family ABC transporter permease [Oscillospiraceae bacterium]|nr:AzlC family ABC transporter permease [Oscillospiraceae bacterium]
MNKKTLFYSFKATIPVMAGYIVLGIAFGVLLESKGYNFLWSLVMSLTIFAGSMQFVTVDLLAGGATLVSAAIMTVLVNARHIFYGISMVDKYRGIGRVKPYLMHALTDETYSLVCDPTLPEDVAEKPYYIIVTGFNHIYWVIGCAVGGLIGGAVEFNTAGLDFAMTALFVVIFVEQWEKAKSHIPAYIGLAAAVICLLVFGPTNFLIPTIIIIPIALFALRPLIEKQLKKDEEVAGND